jgi:hypothetical protein
MQTQAYPKQGHYAVRLSMDGVVCGKDSVNFVNISMAKSEV